MHETSKLESQEDPFLSLLSLETRRLIEPAIRFRRLTANSLVYAQGDSPKSFFRLVDGQVSMSKIALDGSENLIAKLSPPYWFGEMSFLDGAPRTHNAYASSEVELAYIGKAHMKGFMDRHPDFYRAMVMRLCEHTRILYRAVDDFLFMSPERLTAKALLTLLKNNFQSDEISLTQAELARMVGVSRQSISRILRVWETRRVIVRKYGSLIVRNANALSTIAQGGVGS